MRLPIIFKVLESEECAGILAPYILSSEIYNLVESLYNKNKDLINMINSLPNEVVRGSVTRSYKNLPCDSLIESHYTGNSNSYGDPIISGAQASGESNHINLSVLPPHKVYFDDSKLTNPRYEANIYNPCLRDASGRDVFQTGSYPNTTGSTSSSDSSNSKFTNTTSKCCRKQSEKESYVMAKMLESMMDSSIESIAKLQIQNVLTALIQSNRIPTSYSVITGLRVILETVSLLSDKKPEVLISIHRFGLYTETMRSVLLPSKASVIKQFICIDDNEHFDYIKETLSSVLHSYPDTVEISVLTSEQFSRIHSSCPVDLDFECGLYTNPNSSSNEFSITLTDINRFRPDVILDIHVPSHIQPLFPGHQIAVPCGTSGKLSFMLNERDKYELDGVELNGRFYNISTLCDDVFEPSIGKELLSIKGKIKEIDNSSALFELSYIGIYDNINIDLRTISVLDRLECEIDDVEVNYQLSELKVLELCLDNSISHGTCSCTEENDSGEDAGTNVDDTSGTESLPNDQDKICYHLRLNIPFTNPIMAIRMPDNITVHRLIRSFNEEGELSNLLYEDVTDKFNKSLVGTVKDTLVVSNQIDFNTIIEDISEFIITFGRGSLYTPLKVLTESLPATNSEDTLHFAIDPVRCVFALLEDDDNDFPEWVVPVKEELGEDAVNTPDYPSDSEEILTKDNEVTEEDSNENLDDLIENGESTESSN